MKRPISEERRTAYYLGAVIMVIGGLLFASVFITFALHFGDFSNFRSNAKSEMLRALAGMGFLVIGWIIRGIGARGLAGSGVVLDPQRAREDLEPYSRMAGGMVKDALDEAGLDPSGKKEQLIKIKCQACGKLNAEDAKFCQECGRKL